MPMMMLVVRVHSRGRPPAWGWYRLDLHGLSDWWPSRAWPAATSCSTSAPAAVPRRSALARGAQVIAIELPPVGPRRCVSGSATTSGSCRSMRPTSGSPATVAHVVANPPSSITDAAAAAPAPPGRPVSSRPTCSSSAAPRVDGSMRRRQRPSAPRRSHRASPSLPSRHPPTGKCSSSSGAQDEHRHGRVRSSAPTTAGTDQCAWASVSSIRLRIVFRGRVRRT